MLEAITKYASCQPFMNCIALNMYSYYHHPMMVKHSFVDIEVQDSNAYLFLDADESLLLNRCLQSLCHVEKLVIPTICNDSMLYTITSNCEKLKTLDLSYSTNVSDLGISRAFDSEICKCTDLEQIFLESTGARKTSIVHLLRGLKKLEVVDSRHLGSAIDQLGRELESENRMSCEGVGLRRITLTPDHPEQTYDFSRFSTMCPKLQHLILSSFRYDTGLIQISRLTMLQHLCVGEVPLGIIIETLNHIGQNLLTFRYTNFQEFVPIDILISKCPNLDSFGVSAGCLTFSSNSKLFCPNLRCLFLNIHAIIGRKIWQSFFSNCHKLEVLDMTPADELTDDSFRQECLDYPGALQKIRTFIVRGRHRAGDISLSEKTIFFLVSHCEKLNIIGSCVTWSISSSCPVSEYICLTK